MPKQHEGDLDSRIEETNEEGTENCEHSSVLPFDEFKKSLGMGATKYTDKQINEIRIVFDRIADAAFDKWLEQRNSGKMAISAD
jgi:hypothetical protein